MAMTIYDLLVNKGNILEKAKREFKESTNGKKYVPGISVDAVHPVIES